MIGKRNKQVTVRPGGTSQYDFDVTDSTVLILWGGITPTPTVAAEAEL